MTLANKISCHDNNFKQHGRADGFEFLYVSQMKNNDKEFDMVIERLKKNIPDEQVKEYALKRMESNKLFRDHNSLPYTLPPDNYYIQNHKHKNTFSQNVIEEEKYLEPVELSDDQMSDLGAIDDKVSYFKIIL